MDDVITPLLDSDQIAQRVREMGAAIARDYQGRPLILVCVLKGSFVFAADLARAIDGPVRIEFLGVRSYGAGTTSSGVVQITHDLQRSIEGEDVLLVEDIVDTGLTLSYLQDVLRARDPKSLRTACLLSKPSRRKVDVQVEYIGFEIEDKFVVGYGLDHAGQFRHLPFIGIQDDLT